jgi:thioredoxin 1
MSYTSRYTPETLSRDELDQGTGPIVIEFGGNGQSPRRSACEG